MEREKEKSSAEDTVEDIDSIQEQSIGEGYHIRNRFIRVEENLHEMTKNVNFLSNKQDEVTENMTKMFKMISDLTENDITLSHKDEEPTGINYGTNNIKRQEKRAILINKKQVQVNWKSPIKE